MSEQNSVPPTGTQDPPGETTSSPALKEYQENAQKNVELRKEEILLYLRLMGVVRVEVQYDGCGDSGQIEQLILCDEHQRQIPEKALGKTAEALEDFLYDLLEARHEGWEIGEGAWGEFAWDLVEDHLTHTHNDRFVDSNVTEHEGI